MLPVLTEAEEDDGGMARLVGVSVVRWLFAAAALVVLIPGARAQTATGALIGPHEVVFDTATQGCTFDDIPDVPARAFRDYRNVVHLFASSDTARAMTGSSLLTLTHTCTASFTSAKDAAPAHFRDHNWLDSFYTFDGRTIYSLVHSEYHGWEHPGMCASAAATATHNCWYNTVTMATSLDGGLTFTQTTPAAQLVAAVPYQYDMGTLPGPVGYSSPTNIVQRGGYWYAFINNWPFQAQRYGACLIRTNNIADPTSWRAWDGAGFKTQLINPYVTTSAQPSQHVCAPVAMNAPNILAEVSSISYHANSGAFIAIQAPNDNRFGEPGIYVSASYDLIHWTVPSLIVSFATMQATEPAGSWQYGYVSLLDPASPDRNFVTVGNQPYVYYTRIDLLHPPYVRTLFRAPLRLQVRGG